MLALLHVLRHPSRLREVLLPVEFPIPFNSPNDTRRLRRMNILDLCVAVYIVTWGVSGLVWGTPALVCIPAFLLAHVLMWTSRREWNRLKKVWADEQAQYFLGLLSGRKTGAA